MVGLRGVQESSDCVLISMQKPTQPMRSEPTEAGFYMSPLRRIASPLYQFLTVAKLLDGDRKSTSQHVDANLIGLFAMKRGEVPLTTP
jgi:hypothetical protein